MSDTKKAKIGEVRYYPPISGGCCFCIRPGTECCRRLYGDAFVKWYAKQMHLTYGEDTSRKGMVG